MLSGGTALAVSPPNVYDVGDLVESSVVFTNAAGIRVDPTTVTVKYRAGSGSATTLVYGIDVAVVKDAVGAYHVNITVAEDNVTYYIEWLGTGAAVAAYAGSFQVRLSHF